MAGTRTIDVSDLPEPVIEQVERMLDVLRHNLTPGGEPRPTTINGVPFMQWRQEFLAWCGRIRGRPVVDDSREAIYDRDTE